MTIQNEVLLWPPPAPPSIEGLPIPPPPDDKEETVDLFSVINASGHEHDAITLAPGGGFEIHPGKVVFNSMYPTSSREVQRRIVSDLQRAYARTSQGRELAVKEWADENQNRGILRLRLRCKKAKCKLQFQVNWETTQHHWFIPRQCENLIHTCPMAKASNSGKANKQSKTSPTTSVAQTNGGKKRKTSAKRNASSIVTVGNENNNDSISNRKTTTSPTDQTPPASNGRKNYPPPPEVSSGIAVPRPAFSAEPPPTYSAQPPPAYSAQPPPAYSAQPHPAYSAQPPPTFSAQPPPTFSAQPPPTFSAQPPPTFSAQPPPPPPVPPPAPIIVTDTDQAEAELLATDLEEWIPPEASAAATISSGELPSIVPPHIVMYDEALLAQNHQLMHAGAPHLSQHQQHRHSPPVSSVVVKPPPASAPATIPQHYQQYYHPGQPDSNHPAPSSGMPSMPPAHSDLQKPPPAQGSHAPAPIQMVTIPSPQHVPSTPAPPVTVTFEIPSPTPVVQPPTVTLHVSSDHPQNRRHYSLHATNGTHHRQYQSHEESPQSHEESPPQQQYQSHEEKESHQQSYYHQHEAAAHPPYHTHFADTSHRQEQQHYHQPQHYPSSHQEIPQQGQPPSTPSRSYFHVDQNAAINSLSIGANSLGMMSIECDEDDDDTVGNGMGPPTVTGGESKLEHQSSYLEDGMSVLSETDSCMLTMGSISSKQWMNGLQTRIQSGEHTIGSWFDNNTIKSRSHAASSGGTSVMAAGSNQNNSNLTINDATMMSLTDSVRNMLSLVGYVGKETTTSTGLLAQLYNRTLDSKCSEEAGSGASSAAPVPAPTHQRQTSILAADFFTPPPHVSSLPPATF